MNLLNVMLIVLHTLAAVISAGHALLYKRDPRAALGWIAVCLMFPLAGPLLYFLFGINRVRTRAKKLDRRSPFRLHIGYERSEDEGSLPVSRLQVPPQLSELVRASDAVTRRPLTEGNRIEVLHNGEQAYPAMLKAIEEARHTLYLMTYIFETNRTGQRFIEALGVATERGVDVRVMIDGIGELYSWPRASGLLKARGVRVVRFLPPKLLPPSLHINLRNHRKILIADGLIGFTGGMNIGDRHLAAGAENASPGMADLHFRLMGPVVTQIERVFLTDWGFVTGEHRTWNSPSVAKTGGALCRTVVDGPNEDLEKLTTILIGAVSLARRRILIMTPYFLPNRELIAALQAAALRGVEVVVILPARSNLPFVDWATRNMLWELLRWNVRVYYQPPPFAHTKLFLVDNHYVLIGSANIDPRSLRLNFELTVEVYEQTLSERLSTYIEAIQAQSREVSLQDMDGRPLPIRVRDALVWLLSPYL